MAERWPQIPKRIMGRLYAGHERRHGTSVVPDRTTRSAIDLARITDAETGSWTE